MLDRSYVHWKWPDPTDSGRRRWRRSIWWLKTRWSGGRAVERWGGGAAFVIGGWRHVGPAVGLGGGAICWFERRERQIGKSCRKSGGGGGGGGSASISVLPRT
ncbi:hypothetical protein JCGZ_15517 [Jatropha curcas]|uniref:Uncharacterized protein n=1 Tax=Jatropha curcas TaxID=180498 RepID=A0A067KF65_JATCU|nr:hypothetical protein JCGZ_15517 [Jatropha curcas]